MDRFSLRRTAFAAGEQQMSGPDQHRREHVVYVGYFGAAAGVLMLALVLAMSNDTFPRVTATKNLLSACPNAVAAVAFTLLGPVRWLAVLPLAIGFLGGGRLGPMIVRKAPPMPLRMTIAVAGIGLAIVLGW